MKRVLLHTCCGPCMIGPHTALKEEGYEVFGFWYNPNIHPLTEYNRRKETFLEFTEQNDIRVIWQDEYDIGEFLRNVVYRESQRCSYCYYVRLKAAAHIARKGKFDYFTTTLLYSKFQKHELIRSIGEAAAKEVGVKFLYKDFREHWKFGIEESKRLGMYRQQYCGCIYSEEDRYR